MQTFVEASSTPAARAIGVTKRYGAGDASVTALDEVTLPARRFTAVVGPSGSGKSTLLHYLAGLDSVDAGVVFLGETDLTTLSDRALTALRRERIERVAGRARPAHHVKDRLLPQTDGVRSIR